MNTIYRLQFNLIPQRPPSIKYVEKYVGYVRDGASVLKDIGGGHQRVRLDRDPSNGVLEH